MNSIRFKLRTSRKNKNGLYDLNMEIYKKGFSRKYISLSIEGDSEYWDETQERFVIQKGLRIDKAKMENNERIKNNDLIENYNQKAKEIIRKYDDDQIDWTPNQFKERFTGSKKRTLIHEYLTQHIKILTDTGRIGTAEDYSRTLILLEKYDSNIEQRVFSEIDLKYIKDFEIYLQKRGNKGNTRRNAIKPLRAIYNKAIQDGVANERHYPFGKGGFKVSDLEEETKKRYLPAKYLEEIKNRKMQREVEEYARNLFLFSYYCHGMAFVDMAHLKDKNKILHDDGVYIVYQRQKTKSNRKSPFLHIRIDKNIQRCIDSLAKFREPLGDYLLPIITMKYSGEKLYKHVRHKNKRYNEYLKDLANTLSFDFNLTSYVSRHTMAMQLQNNDISREIISQILGHSDLKTTNIYLDSLDSSVIDKASKVL